MFGAAVAVALVVEVAVPEVAEADAVSVGEAVGAEVSEVLLYRLAKGANDSYAVWPSVTLSKFCLT